MKLHIEGNINAYYVQTLCMIFFPGEKFSDTEEETEDTPVVRLSVAPRDGRSYASATMKCRDGIAQGEGSADGEDQAAQKFASGAAMLDAGRRLFGDIPPWGMLTGVRPVRLVHNELEKGMTEEQAAQHLRSTFGVSEKKLSLAVQTAHNQRRWVESVRPEDYSLYISIPFCPSRCSYCSFVSRTIENSRDLVQPYVDTLCRELVAIADQAQRFGLNLRTVYMGGGTPTSLSAAQLRTVMQCIKDHFPLESALEYTVEAGRPDCTDEEKLAVIKELGADRISINPQTLQDPVLKNIGRRHSAQDILDCFAAARRVGHTNINMDLIAGLPGDTVAGFDDTLQKGLQPGH